MNSNLVKASSALTLSVLMAAVVASNAPAFAINGHGSAFGQGPQFGEGPYLTYNDGLTINGATFDISQYKTTINTQTLYVNQENQITVKVYDHAGAQQVQNVFTFLDLHGNAPQTFQTKTYIGWDKNTGVIKQDPNGLFKSVTTTVKYDKDGRLMYVTFHIVPNMTMDASNIIIRAIDNNLSQNQVVVLNAIKIGYVPTSFSSVGQ